MRRSKLEMYIDILFALAHRGPLKLTHIMRKANINCIALKENLNFLITKGLVEERTFMKRRRLLIAYAVTQRGITVLKYFREMEKRRIIEGIVPYGWFGNVAASGQVRHLFAKGSQKQWAQIVSSVNHIASFNLPIVLSKLKSHLEDLVNLGPSMKVWGRILCIVRPDFYCTIASDSVRNNLAKTLGVSQNHFVTPEGYI